MTSPCYANTNNNRYKILNPPNNLVMMAQFHKAVAFRNEIDIDEVECMVANLIYRKYIKGYIARRGDSSALKLDKTEAFPPLAKIFSSQTL